MPLCAGGNACHSSRDAVGVQTPRLAYYADMPDIGSTLKAEISRIARKEIRGEIEDFRKSSTQYRSQIAALRRRVESLERELKRVGKQPRQPVSPEPDEGDSAVQRRFSASRLAGTRKKLGLSAADFGALIGVTGQSIYKWEAGEARPRSKQLAAIATVRGIGKREATARLQAISDRT